MKHVARVSKQAPALAIYNLGSIFTWESGILGANEIGDFVIWLTRLAEGILNWDFLPTGIEKSGGDPDQVTPV